MSEKIGGRELKKRILLLLKNNDVENSLKEICNLPARQAVNPLFSFFYNTDELVKWRAINAMGAVTANLAERNMESARVIMRRLLWNLNDESGGIGWGSPEAMGEIMVRNERLADEYSSILVSYISSDGNFIEHEFLQRGVLWGLGRLAHARPHLVKESAPFLVSYLQSQDAILRGIAAWAAEPLGNKIILPALERLSDDNAKLNIFLDQRIVECSVSWLAIKAIDSLNNL